jgi:hypothetical protein
VLVFVGASWLWWRKKFGSEEVLSMVCGDGAERKKRK